MPRKRANDRNRLVVLNYKIEAMTDPGRKGKAREAYRTLVQNWERLEGLRVRLGICRIKIEEEKRKDHGWRF